MFSVPQILRKSVWAKDAGGEDRKKNPRMKNLAINGRPSAQPMQRLDSAPSLPLTTTAKRVGFAEGGKSGSAF